MLNWLYGIGIAYAILIFLILLTGFIFMIFIFIKLTKHFNEMQFKQDDFDKKYTKISADIQKRNEKVRKDVNDFDKKWDDLHKG